MLNNRYKVEPNFGAGFKVEDHQDKEHPISIANFLAEEDAKAFAKLKNDIHEEQLNSQFDKQVHDFLTFKR